MLGRRDEIPPFARDTDTEAQRREHIEEQLGIWLHVAILHAMSGSPFRRHTSSALSNATTEPRRTLPTRRRLQVKLGSFVAEFARFQTSRPSRPSQTVSRGKASILI